MGELAKQLDSMSVKAQSPDANLRGILSKSGFSFGIRPNTYGSYETDDLGYQLTSLLRRIEVKYRREHKEITESRGVRIPLDPREARSEAQRIYLAKAAEVEVVGSTTRKLVRIKSVGMRNWKCRIADQTVNVLSDDEFVAEVEGASNNLVQNYRQEIRKLKATHLYN